MSSLGACVSFPPGGQVVYVFSQGDNVLRDAGVRGVGFVCGSEAYGMSCYHAWDPFTMAINEDPWWLLFFC